MPHKIIFLDIDGVLNRTSGPNFLTLPAFNMDAPWLVEKNIVEFFLRSIEPFHPELKLVCSSTWRYHVTNLQHLCKATGIPIAHFHDDWAIPIHGGEDRPMDIYHWLKRNPTVSDYVILDDNKYNFSLVLGKQPIFVRVNAHHGLTKENLNQALSILGYAPIFGKGAKA